MKSSQYLNQLHTVEKLADEPWPEDATLYQPLEAEQILLPENASCLAVKTYMKMCNLPFDVRCCANAEHMSPGGRMTKLPFLRAGAFIFAEFEAIAGFVEQKDMAIGTWQDEDEKADMRTYVKMVENIFTMAELYVSFKNDRVYKDITAPRNGAVYPWPLNIMQNYSKRRNAIRQLKVYQWNDLTIKDVIGKVELSCEQLEYKLKESPDTPFFFGDQPCELDAIAFGHLFTILTTRLPNMALAQTVQKFKHLVEFCRFIDDKYFQMKSLRN